MSEKYMRLLFQVPGNLILFVGILLNLAFWSDAEGQIELTARGIKYHFYYNGTIAK